MSVPITVYMSAEDKQLVEERATANGISVSEYAYLATVKRTARRAKHRLENGADPGREKW
jgi:hypothetical protein